MVKKAHYDYINHEIDSRLSEQQISFCSYDKMMQQKIPTLKTQTGLCATDTDNADTLDEQSLSVFPMKEI